jgi:hypothetical protein
MLKITSNVHSVGESMPAFDESVVKYEPMSFNCDLDNAYNLGGEITENFINRLPDSWTAGPLVIDSRVHMLMPGWFPCIPGWHHDEVPRTRIDGQPNYAPGQIRSEHIMVLINGDICPTEFALGLNITLEEPELGKIIYEYWHRDVEVLIKNKSMWVQKVESGKLYRFDDRSFHRGTAAIAGGWRYFARATRYLKDGIVIAPPKVLANETRKQVQVYLQNPMQGW